MAKLKQPQAVLFNFIIFFAFLLTSLNFPVQALAGAAFVDTSSVKSSMSLVPYSEYLIDPGASLQIEELFSAGETQNFKALSNGIPLTFSGSIWFRVTLAPTTKPSPDGELVLDLGPNVPKGAILYYPIKNQEPGQPSVWQGRKPGSTYSLPIGSEGEAQSSIKLSPYQIKLPPANEVNPTTIYVNIPGTPSIWFAPTLRTAEDAMRDKESVPLYFAMCLLGVCIALCLLRAFRDGGEWRLWTAVLGTLILSQTLIDLPPMPKGQVPFSGLLNVLIPALSLALVPHVARHLFDTKAINKNFDKLWLYLSILGAIVPVFALVPGYSWLIRILPLWPILAFLPGLFAIGAVVKKLPGAGKYMSSCFLLAACTLLSLLATTNVAPNNIFTTTPLWGGSIFALLIGILPIRRKEMYSDSPQTLVNAETSGPTLSLGDVLDLGGSGENTYTQQRAEENDAEAMNFLIKTLHESQQDSFAKQNLPAGSNTILNETRFEDSEELITLGEKSTRQNANVADHAARESDIEDSSRKNTPQSPLQLLGQTEGSQPEELLASKEPAQPEILGRQDTAAVPAWALHLTKKAEPNALDQSETSQASINQNVGTPTTPDTLLDDLLSINEAASTLAQEQAGVIGTETAEPEKETNNTWLAFAKNEENTQTPNSAQDSLLDSAKTTAFATQEATEGVENPEQLDEQKETPQAPELGDVKSNDYIPAWARSTLANAKIKAEEESKAAQAPETQASAPHASSQKSMEPNTPFAASTQENQPETAETTGKLETPENPESPESPESIAWTPSVKPLDMAATPRPMPYPARSHALGKITHINSVLPIVSADEPAKDAGQTRSKAPRIPMSPWAKTIAKEAMQLDATSLGKIEECLKVPLEALVQAASELSTCSLPPLARQRSEAIIKSSQMLSELVNTLTSAPNEPLEILETESNEEAVFDLQVVLREAHDTVVNKAERRGLALSWFMPPHMPLLYIGNPTQLQNVLRLLLDSAIESTYRGSVQIAVRRVPDSTNPGHLVFTVTDTGQTSPSLRRSTTALMRAWEMVTADGGALSLDSAPNHGTIVSFTLHLKVPGKQVQHVLPVYGQSPAIDSNAYENQDKILYPGLQPEYQPLSLTRLQPLNILVADEQTTNRQLLSFFLNDLPYTIEEAKTVKDAIAIYAEAPVGLVIFDSTLSDLDLATAIKTVHDIDASLNIPPVPIVALVQNHADIDPAVEAGSAAAIRKPLSRGKVRDIVTRLLPIPEELLNAMRPKAEPITEPEEEEKNEPQHLKNDEASEAASQEGTALNNGEESLTLDPVEGIISAPEDQEEAIELQPWKTEAQLEKEAMPFPKTEPELQEQSPECLSFDSEHLGKNAESSTEESRTESGLSLAAAARRFMRIRRKPAPEPSTSQSHMEIVEDGTVSAPRPVGSLSGKVVAPAEAVDPTEALGSLGSVASDNSAKTDNSAKSVEWMPAVESDTHASSPKNNEGLSNSFNQASNSGHDSEENSRGVSDGDRIQAQIQARTPWFSMATPPEEVISPAESVVGHADTLEQHPQMDEHPQTSQLNWSNGESVSEPRPIIKKEAQPALKITPISGSGDELDPEVIHLIPGLLDSLDMALNDAYTGLENNSFLTVAEACMRISGTADAHGLRVLKGIANCVERAANANDLDAVTDLLAELDSSVQNNRKKLERIYDTHSRY